MATSDRRLIDELQKALECKTRNALAKALALPPETLARWTVGQMPRTVRHLIKKVLNPKCDLTKDADILLD